MVVSAKTLYEAVKYLAEHQTVEGIVNNITQSGQTLYEASLAKDLIQDIYSNLLEKPKFLGVFNANQERYYITRMVLNNIASNNSPFYMTYIRPMLLNNGEFKEIDEDDEW